MLRSGIFHLFETLKMKSVKQVYDEAIEECVYAEELGYEAAHPAEHHFSEHYGIMPRTEIFLAYLAAKTTRIKLAPQVIVSPLANPVRLAEDCAMIDVLSGGRFTFSCGAGYRGYEFAKMGLDIDTNRERLKEICEMMEKAWSGKPISHKGKYYEINDAIVVPQPLHKPDIWVTTATPDSIKWGAQKGYTVVATAGFSLKAFQRDIKVLQDNGVNTKKATVPFFKWIYVADTEKEAQEVGRPAFIKTISAFMVGGERLVEGLLKSIQMAEGEDKMRRLSGEDIGAFVCGTPDRIVQELKPFVESGGNYFIGGFNIGALPTEKIQRSMELFAKEVAPRL